MKPTFKDFLKVIYGATLDDYNQMNDLQKKAVEVDYYVFYFSHAYKSRYNSIKHAYEACYGSIKWE